jgi:hypothetical protein
MGGGLRTKCCREYFERRADEATGVWSKLHIKDLHDLHS